MTFDYDNGEVSDLQDTTVKLHYEIALSADNLMMDPLPNSFLSFSEDLGTCFSIYKASSMLNGNTVLSVARILVVYL